MSGQGKRTEKFYGTGAVLMLLVLAGCSTPPAQRAPVIDRSVSVGIRAPEAGPAYAPAPVAAVPVRRPVSREGDWRPQSYIVQKGDTLYSIAFNFGFDYRELADLNGIQNPALIHVGQEIRLFAAGSAAVVESRPVNAMPMDNIKSQPVAVKLPYSEQAVAQIEKGQGEPATATVEVQPIAKAEPRPLVKTGPQPDSRPEAATAADVDAESAVKWGVPAEGKVIAGFSEGDNRKGVDIAGKLGQPVYASAAGKVVYSGSGLRGYGKLIIIKHNNTYLSAYAHNDKLLMKEGQSVAKGQKIAEMGNTDTDRVKLHFEIRKLGKPVDPARYVALSRS